MLSDLTINQFLEKAASAEPVPGGGSMGALGAAISASLVCMVANVTIGKKGYESVESLMQNIAETASEYQAKFVQDIDRDADAYRQVITAFKLPKSTESEKNIRTQSIQEAFKHACRVPLEMASDAFQLMELAGEVTAKGNKNASTDGAVAVMMARTAVLAGLYNVKINLASITDSAFTEDISRQVQDMEAGVEKKEKEMLVEAGRLG